jgi:hypothetical protein
MKTLSEENEMLSIDVKIFIKKAIDLPTIDAIVNAIVNTLRQNMPDLSIDNPYIGFGFICFNGLSIKKNDLEAIKLNILDIINSDNNFICAEVNYQNENGDFYKIEVKPQSIEVYCTPITPVESLESSINYEGKNFHKSKIHRIEFTLDPTLLMGEPEPWDDHVCIESIELLICGDNLLIPDEDVKNALIDIFDQMIEDEQTNIDEKIVLADADDDVFTYMPDLNPFGCISNAVLTDYTFEYPITSYKFLDID